MSPTCIRVVVAEIEQLPGHRLAELRRFFQDYKVLEGKEVDVDHFSDLEEAKDAVRHAMRLYDEHFAQTGHSPGTKAG